MTALLFLTTARRGVDPADTPLARSLAAQHDRDARLVAVGEHPGARGPVRVADALSPAVLATAGAVAVCDDDTVLEPGAVRRIVGALDDHPEAAAVYGDETRTAGPLEGPILRPGWSPDLLRCRLYTGDPLAVRTAAIRTLSDLGAGPAGRLRLALHLVETGATVLHLPVPLARRPGPVVAPSDHAAIVARHLERCGVPARVVDGTGPGEVELLPTVDETTTVTVIVPTAGTGGSSPETGRSGDGGSDTDEPFVRRCLRSLDAISRPTIDVIAVVGDEYDGDPSELCDSTRHPLRIIHRGHGPFSFPAAVNAGLLGATGRLALLLNDDTEGHDGDWLATMAMHAVDPGVGAVGALLLYPDGTIQHAGMVFDDARPLHAFVGHEVGDEAPRRLLGHPRTVAAVTGACLLVERSKALAVGGMSSRLPHSFNDVDMCLKLARAGYRTVLEPAAVLTHREGASRAATIERWEWDRYVRRWGEIVDPWYHPGYVRPGDPARPSRDADHIRPAAVATDLDARDSAIRPTVHHTRRSVPADGAGVERYGLDVEDHGGDERTDADDEQSHVDDERTDAVDDLDMDTDDTGALRAEVLRQRDVLVGARAHREVLEDRVRELEQQVDELAAGLEKYERVTAHPVVRTALTATRPIRRFVDRRRSRP